MDCRIQLLFLPQGKPFAKDPRTAYIVLGFLGFDARAPRSQGRAILALRTLSGGAIRGTLEAAGPWPRLDRSSDSYQLSDLCTHRIWHNATREQHPSGLILGDILYRPVAARHPKLRHHAFIGVILAAPDAMEPICHQRYDQDIVNGIFKETLPMKVDALTYEMGATPNHYLMAPGWDLGRDQLAGLQSTLGIAALKDYDRRTAMEKRGASRAEIDAFVQSTDVGMFERGGDDYLAWRVLYHEELAKSGIDQPTLLAPLTAPEIALREDAGARAMARLMTAKGEDL